MDIRLMEYVLEVNKEKSFTKAAMKLHIAQPSISQQIAKLEVRIGVKLFDRGRNSVSLTNDGKRFIEYAAQIIQLRDDLVNEMDERGNGMKKELIIGTTAITGSHLLPLAIQKFGSLYPNVNVRLIEETTESLTERTINGDIDISILTLPIMDKRLDTKIIFSEKLFLALSKKEGNKIKNKVSLADFSNQPFIILKEGFGFRRSVFELCAQSGFSPQIAYETSSMETAQELVAHNLGVTLVPEMIIRKEHREKNMYLELTEQLERTIVFAYNRTRYLGKGPQAFMDMFDQIK